MIWDVENFLRGLQKIQQRKREVIKGELIAAMVLSYDGLQKADILNKSFAEVCERSALIAANVQADPSDVVLGHLSKLLADICRAEKRRKEPADKFFTKYKNDRVYRDALAKYGSLRFHRTPELKRKVEECEQDELIRLIDKYS